MQKKIEGTDEEYFSRPNNLRELTVQEHLTVFIMKYIKDMKNECIEILLHPLIFNFIESCNVNEEDLSRLDDEQVLKFKELFMANKVKGLKNCGKTMDSILDIMIDIATKRVPSDNTQVKPEQIRDKVRFVPYPEGVIEDNYEDEVPKAGGEEGAEPIMEKVKYESNVDFKAMMFLKVPQREQEEEIPIELNSKDGEEPDEGAVQTVIRMVDEDQQGKALAIIGRNPVNMVGD